MIKIIVVEDQLEKRQQIIAHLTSLPDIGLENVKHVDNVIDAKNLLKTTRFDLLILDLNIPRRVDELPTRGAGLDIIRFIKNNVEAIPPTYIYGMTAYDDAFAEASVEFSSALWKLVMFSPDDHSWQRSLAEAVLFLVSRDSPPFVSDGTSFHLDVGIVVALDEELAPFKGLLGNWTELQLPYDPARYFRGTLQIGDQLVSVVAVASPRMGLPAAAVTTTKLVGAFRPRYVITSGICAGVRDKTKIGDLLVSDPSFDWGSGKWVRTDTGSLVFKPAAYPWRLSESMRRRIAILAEDSSMLGALARNFCGKRPENTPVVMIDAMASGGSVLQAESLMADVRALHKNLIGVDMENYGVLTAVEYCGEPQPRAVAIKSVCDFGDGEKDDDYHEYAAHLSASFACQLIACLEY